MILEELLDEVSKSSQIKVDKSDDEIDISIKDGEIFSRILRVYPQNKTAEFLDIEDVWDELHYALEDKYGTFPEVAKIADFLNQNKYSITW